MPSETRTPDVSETPTWRCTEQRSHGTCNTYNDLDEETCGACGADRPAAAVPVATREPTATLAWSCEASCVGGGYPALCFMYPNEKHEGCARCGTPPATPTPSSALLEAATLEITAGDLEVLLVAELSARRANAMRESDALQKLAEKLYAYMRALPPSPAPGA